MLVFSLGLIGRPASDCSPWELAQFFKFNFFFESKFSDIKVSIVACGWDFSIVVSSGEGKVFACGSNAFGQLGQDVSLSKLDTFEQIQALNQR